MTSSRLLLLKKATKLYGNYACCLAFMLQSPIVLGLATTAILLHGFTIYLERHLY